MYFSHTTRKYLKNQKKVALKWDPREIKVCHTPHLTLFGSLMVKDCGIHSLTHICIVLFACDLH